MTFLDLFSFFFILINPITSALLFLGLTASFERSLQRAIAIKACAVSLGVASTFALIGDRFLVILKISPPALRISGGLLLLIIASKMVMTGRKIQIGSGHARPMDLAIFPLAMPKLAGPASLTGIAVKVGEAAGNFTLQLFIVFVLACVHGVTLVLFLGGRTLMRLTGPAGSDALVRFFGLLLAAMAGHMVLTGSKTFLLSL